MTGTGRPHGFLTGDEWRTLEVAGRPRRYRARQRLFREGEPGDHVIAVLGGRVKVSVQTRSGREILLAIKEPGDLVGELSAIDGRPRSATAIALEPVDALVVTAPAFVEFVEGHPRGDEPGTGPAPGRGLAHHGPAAHRAHRPPRAPPPRFRACVDGDERRLVTDVTAPV